MAVDACAGSCSSGGALPGAAAAAAKVEDAAGVEQVKECSLAYRRSLLLQQQRSDRMKILMGKDSFLRTWFSSFLYGQLSWVQLARMHVLMFPFYPVPVVFFAENAAKAAHG